MCLWIYRFQFVSILNQISGLADYFSVKGFDKDELGGFDKIVSLIEKERLEFVPGESFAYSKTAQPERCVPASSDR
jgi:hypothetical protein